MENNALSYQAMIAHQRHRHKASPLAGWPDTPMDAPAASRYPNILAELDASGWWLDRIVRYAEVSPAIMVSVMESNGELALRELHGLTRCFGCKMDYLAAPVLSMVDPSTSKGKRCIQRLKELERRTEGMDGAYRFLYDLHSRNVLPDLESGRSVTYAAYRWACLNLQQELDREVRSETKQRRTRAEELAQAQIPMDNQAALSARIQLARERDRAKKVTSRLSEIREYTAGVKISVGATTQDLLSLMEFSKADLAGSLVLAILYGQTIGYRAAKAEV